MKILVVGDSVVFGRPKYSIYYSLTWPAILSESGAFVMQRARGGSGMSDVKKELKMLESYFVDDLAIEQDNKFDFCFVQAGIVDVTPRILTRKIRNLLSRTRIGGRLVKKLNSNRYLISKLGRPDVDQNTFFEHASEVYRLGNLMASKVIFIGIAPPFNNLIINCGNFSSDVTRYNSVLEKVSNGDVLYIDKSEENFLPDGHHFTKKGHSAIGKKLLSIISD